MVSLRMQLEEKAFSPAPVLFYSFMFHMQAEYAPPTYTLARWRIFFEFRKRFRRHSDVYGSKGCTLKKHCTPRKDD